MTGSGWLSPTVQEHRAKADMIVGATGLTCACGHAGPADVCPRCWSPLPQDHPNPQTRSWLPILLCSDRVVSATMKEILGRLVRVPRTWMSAGALAPLSLSDNSRRRNPVKTQGDPGSPPVKTHCPPDPGTRPVPLVPAPLPVWSVRVRLPTLGVFQNYLV